MESSRIVAHYLVPNSAGLPRIIPILLRPSDWQNDERLARLRPLPSQGKPVSQWENAKDAFQDIANGIKQAIKNLRGAGNQQVSPFFSLPPPMHNPFFTGREELLTKLHSNLVQRKTTALIQAQAISGLGGVGKTQIAIEYAYRNRKAYRNVFWVSADTRATLIKDYVKIAEGLGLAKPNKQDQRLTVQMVMGWLEMHSKWLLVLDNADDIRMVSTFVPNEAKGHILLTTRGATVGSIAEKIEIEPMKLDEGTRLLLRRAKKLHAGQTLDAVDMTNRILGEKIVDELDGLPLALDQAGAYIVETGCGLAGYLQLYQQQRSQLLSRRGGGLNPDHPASVVTTFLLLRRSRKLTRKRRISCGCVPFLLLMPFPKRFFLPTNGS